MEVRLPRVPDCNTIASILETLPALHKVKGTEVQLKTDTNFYIQRYLETFLIF